MVYSRCLTLKGWYQHQYLYNIVVLTFSCLTLFIALAQIIDLRRLIFLIIPSLHRSLLLVHLKDQGGQGYLVQAVYQRYRFV